MNVLHVHSGERWGGVESVIAALARHAELAPDLHSSWALASDAALATRLRELGAPVHLFGPARLSRPWLLRQARRALDAIAAAEHADVVLCHAPWALVVAGPVARRRGIPLALWLHGPASRHWLHRWAARQAPALVLANSRFTSTSAAAAYPSARVVVVYPPVSPPAADETVTGPLPAGPADAAVILVACRIESLKGHALLLEALARMRTRRDWSCWIAGGAYGPAGEALLSRLRRDAGGLRPAGRVHFLGERDDVPALLRRASLLCQPNTGPEAFGVVFVEALWRGVPVVTSRLGGAPEIVDETCGILLPPGDAPALAAALTRLVDDPDAARRLGAAGPARARTLCDPAQQMRALANALAPLLR